MSAAEVMESFAAFEAAYEDFTKRRGESGWQLSDTESVQVLTRMHALLSRAHSDELALVRDVETRGVPAAVGATSVRAWLNRTLLLSPSAAGDAGKLAASLQEGCQATGDALASGAVNSEQAAKIVWMLEHLPSKTTHDQRAWAENFLLDQARTLDAAELGKLSKHLDNAINPDGTIKREEAANERRAATIRNNHDGSQTLIYRDSDERIAALKAAMDSLSAPNPAADGTKDPRPAEIRRADAVREIVDRVLRHGKLPYSRGVRPSVVITVSEQTWTTGQGFGRTETGEDLSAQRIQRHACDANLIAILMNDAGVPLKMGRSTRTVTHDQFIALRARDVGCVFPSCTRPASFCDAHHIIWWRNLGPTDLDNLALVCSKHHDAVHHQGWEMFLGKDHHPWLRPPAWVDSERTLVRNTYWTDQQAIRDALSDPHLFDSVSYPSAHRTRATSGTMAFVHRGAPCCRYGAPRSCAHLPRRRPSRRPAP